MEDMEEWEGGRGGYIGNEVDGGACNWLFVALNVGL